MSGIMVFIVVGTSIWVAFDASRIGVKSGQLKGMFGMGPVGWFFCCLFLWIVCFPAYLVKRAELIAINSAETSPIAPADPPPSVGVGDRLAQLEKLGDLRDKGLLTEDEFAAKKSELLR